MLIAVKGMKDHSVHNTKAAVQMLKAVLRDPVPSLMKVRRSGRRRRLLPRLLVCAPLRQPLPTGQVLAGLRHVVGCRQIPTSWACPTT